ncbi:Uncharacterized protein APZ42_000441, partial [Daphnia magna]
KGKVRPLAILEKSLLYQDAFSSLGASETIDENTISTIGLYVCEMYGFKKHTGNADQLDVDDARLQIFSKVYQSGSSNPMSKVKGLDGSSLPPCNTVLFQQILRANSICSGWNFATDPKPHIFPPDKNGWRKEKNNSGVESYN